MPVSAHGRQIGHEFLGVVERIGSDVTTVKVGDLVVASFSYQDNNTCEFCRAGVQTACVPVGFGHALRPLTRRRWWRSETPPKMGSAPYRERRTEPSSALV